MVNRSFRVANYKFNSGDHKALLAFIPGNDREKAELFLRHVEARLDFFIPEREHIANTPIPRGNDMRKSLKNIARLAADLSIKLEDLDPVGELPKLQLALYRMRQPCDLSFRCSNMLVTLNAAAITAMSLVPVDVGGAPNRDHDVGLIAELALDYERLYGRLPQVRREGWFCKFIDKLYAVISGVPGLIPTTNYRHVKKAIDRIRADRKHI